MIESAKVYPHSHLTHDIIGAAQEVHRQLGLGFLEKVYANALAFELRSRSHSVTVEAPIEVGYKDQNVGVYFADLLVEGSVICEIKAIQSLAPEHEAQLLNYLKATGIKVGLLINFGRASLQVKRMVF